MNVIEVEPPAIEPVSLEEMRTYLRVDAVAGSPAFTADDAMIEGMIAAARRAVEQRTNRSFIRRRLRLVTDELPRVWTGSRCGCWGLDPQRRNGYGRLYVELPRSPAIEVHSVEYRDSDGALTAITDGWWLDADQMPGRLYMGNAYWPMSESLRIEYTAGYPETGSPSPGDSGLLLTPPEVKLAIKFHVEIAYDKLQPDAIAKRTEAINNLLAPLTVYSL